MGACCDATRALTEEACPEAQAACDIIHKVEGCILARAVTQVELSVPIEGQLGSEHARRAKSEERKAREGVSIAWARLQHHSLRQINTIGDED